MVYPRGRLTLRGCRRAVSPLLICFTRLGGHAAQDVKCLISVSVLSRYLLFHLDNCRCSLGHLSFVEYSPRNVLMADGDWEADLASQVKPGR